MLCTFIILASFHPHSAHSHWCCDSHGTENKLPVESSDIVLLKTHFSQCRQSRMKKRLMNRATPEICQSTLCFKVWKNSETADIGPPFCLSKAWMLNLPVSKCNNSTWCSPITGLASGCDDHLPVSMPKCHLRRIHTLYLNPLRLHCSSWSDVCGTSIFHLSWAAGPFRWKFPVETSVDPPDTRQRRFAGFWDAYPTSTNSVNVHLHLSQTLIVFLAVTVAEWKWRQWLLRLLPAAGLVTLMKVVHFPPNLDVI